MLNGYGCVRKDLSKLFVQQFEVVQVDIHSNEVQNQVITHVWDADEFIISLSY